MSSELTRAGALPRAPWERRRGDRRRQVLRALLLGNLHARRRLPRRTSDHSLAAVDWHHPQWLAISILIVVFSSADALLTLELIGQGAYETNPLMRPLVGSGSALAFTLIKVGLTAGGVVVLTLMARTRLFGRLSAGLLLYALLAGYGALILYEVSLLDFL